MFYKDERICDLALEAVQLVTKSVKNGIIEDADEARMARITGDVEHLTRAMK